MSLPVRIAHMQQHDLPEVMAIEAVSFPTPWSINTYRYEISRNELGNYYVVRVTDPQLAQAQSLVAYGGFWNMGDSAHITTIATHPQWRRMHLAAWLMLHMMTEAAALGIDAVTLEVRAGNGAARRLYRGLAFDEVGIRRRYYPPTRTAPAEDAILMTHSGLTRTTTAAWLQRQSAAVGTQLAAAFTARAADEPESGSPHAP